MGVGIYTVDHDDSVSLRRRGVLLNGIRIIGLRMDTGVMAMVVLRVVGILARGRRNIAQPYAAGIFKRLLVIYATTTTTTTATIAMTAHNGVCTTRIVALILDLVGHGRGGKTHHHHRNRCSHKNHLLHRLH